MTKLVEKIEIKAIDSLLGNNIDIDSIDKIEEFYETKNQTFARKRFYKVHSKHNQFNIHLTCGYDLSSVFKKHVDAFELFSDIISKPLFCEIREDGLSLLGQEFCEGLCLDEIDDEKCVTQILEKIKTRLATSIKNSSQSEMFDEIKDFKSNFFDVVELNSFDKEILSKVIFPQFECIVKVENYQKRWSCGDMAGRNIFISQEGEIKITDLEFACETHFFNEDWLRLRQYSKGIIPNIPFLENQLSNIPNFIEVYFWLRQFVLDGKVQCKNDKKEFLKLNLANAILAMDSGEGFLKTNSLILGGLYKVSSNHRKIVKSLSHEINVKNKIINSGQHKVEFLLDKIYRMDSSVSWRVTGFLRFLRRILLDPIKRSNAESKAVLPSSISRLNNNSFGEWVSLYDMVDEQRFSFYRKKSLALRSQTKISIILPVYNPTPVLLKRAIGSVIDQIYTNWELCIVDDASDSQEIRNLLCEYEKKDERIKIHFSKKNKHISLASNKALELSSGKFICMLDHDDELRPHSLLVLAKTINKYPDAKLIYSDEDKIDSNGNRSGPYFKPDWNPELLLSQNYFCHLVCIQKIKVNEVGGFRKGFEGCQDWDLFLRITETLLDNEIIHIPQILYHWRKSNSSTAKSLKSKDYILKSAKKTLSEVLVRRNIRGNIISSNSKFSYWRIKRELPVKKPLVSILIPTRNRLDYLKKCIDSIVSKTIYDNYEIIILDNESNEADCIEYLEKLHSKQIAKVIEVKGEFNYSKINNIGVKQATGEIVALVNNDVEVISNDWLCEMVSHVLRNEIGCVGAKLLYPDKTIQHAGVILGLGGVAGHAYKRFPKDHPGQLYRLHLLQNFEAITAACLLVRKSVYEEVNGLDEDKFKVAFNDVDFCLKVRNKGYRNLWTPYAVLFHHESVTRGSDQTEENHKRFMNEVNAMKKKWKSSLEHDPTYNPNLSYDREDFSLAFPPKHHTNGIL